MGNTNHISFGLPGKQEFLQAFHVGPQIPWGVDSSYHVQTIMSVKRGII